MNAGPVHFSKQSQPLGKITATVGVVNTAGVAAFAVV